MGASVRAGAELDKDHRPDDEKLGVVDKVATILTALEAGPKTLAELMAATGLPRATAHRLAVRLGRHGLVGRSDDGRFALGVRLIGLGRAAAEALPLRTVAGPILRALRDETGESVQLYVPEADGRRCVMSLQSPHGLRWIVSEGALLPLDRGSAGRVLRAGAPAGDCAANRQSQADWVESVEEREAGVASVSVPVFSPDGSIVAAVSVSGPVERLSRQPGIRFGSATAAAGRAITAALRRGA